MSESCVFCSDGRTHWEKPLKNNQPASHQQASQPASHQPASQPATSHQPASKPASDLPPVSQPAIRPANSAEGLKFLKTASLFLYTLDNSADGVFHGSLRVGESMTSTEIEESSSSTQFVKRGDR